MSGKYVRADDVMELINTSNRGSCDYFIVDQIEELCSSEKIYDLDKVVEQLDTYITKLVGRNSALYQTVMQIVKGGGV